ncbi:MAG: porphobilinogen synthase [Nitrososphaera sp.]
MQQFERHGYEESYSNILASVGLRKGHLVLPLFVSDSHGKIDSMPGMSLTPVGELEQHVQQIADSGIRSIVMFGVPTTRDTSGISAADEDGIVQRGVRAIKSGFGSSINVTTDVCVCQYNTSGHCGLVRDGRVDNDSTVEMLIEIAASHADAGADFVAPSSMMDGQVHAIRTELDDRGLKSRILSYSAKHASSLYTPFRAAAFARSNLKVDKSSYQVSYANPRQVLREIETDIGEGADMVMIKPALAYLDLIRMAKDRFGFPLAAQNVSGEYAMIKAAAMRGWIDEEEWKVRSLASIRRAGADRIISYFSLDVAKYL